jgi:hypothetical protein
MTGGVTGPVRGRPENAKPGSEGMTTSKASSGSPSWPAGSVSSAASGSISKKLLGQPWVRTSGSAGRPGPEPTGTNMKLPGPPRNTVVPVADSQVRQSPLAVAAGWKASRSSSPSNT